MGIGVEQIFGKLGGFFSTNVNPLALKAIDWKFFAIYCGWITFEFFTVYLLYPETYNRTLEELAICKFTPSLAHNQEQKLTSTQCSRTTSSSTSKPLPPRRSSTRRCRTPPGSRKTRASPSSALSKQSFLVRQYEADCEGWWFFFLWCVCEGVRTWSTIFTLSNITPLGEFDHSLAILKSHVLGLQRDVMLEQCLD